MSADYNPAEYVTVPDGWTCKRLADCTIDGNISYGIVQPGKHDDNGIPIIRVNNVNNGNLNLSDVLKVSTEVEAKFQRTRLKGGEVLLTLVGSTGQSFVAPEELCGWNVPRAIAVIRTEESVGAEWVNICLQSNEAKHFLNVRANTTVQKTLNLKDVRDIPILIPPKATKAFIEKTALSISQKIKLNRQTNHTLENIAQAIFKSWFVDFDPTQAKISAKEKGQDPELAAMSAIAGKSIDELGTLSDKQIEKLKVTAALFSDKLVESELGEIPEGWEVGSMKDFGEVTDYVANGSFASLKENVTYVEDGYAVVIRLTDYNSGWQGEFNYVDEHAYNFLSKSRVNSGDIVISNVGANAGTVFRVPDLEKAMTLGPNSILVKSESARLYLFYHFTSHLGQHQLDGIKGGSAQPKFNKTDFRSLRFLKPVNEILAAFNSLIAPIENMCFNNDKSSKKLSEFREALLPKLLSGEIDVKMDL